MDRKLLNQEKEKSEGKEIHELKQVSCTKSHTFVHTKKAREVQCINCPVGFILSSNSTLKDSHIYINGQLVI